LKRPVFFGRDFLPFRQQGRQIFKQVPFPFHSRSGTNHEEVSAMRKRKAGVFMALLETSSAGCSASLPHHSLLELPSIPYWN
jgi:hypothetical protein